jgi:hypothetical protein
VTWKQFKKRISEALGIEPLVQSAYSDLSDLEFKVGRLDLKPGDLLVAKFKERLPQTAIGRIRESFNAVIPGVKVLVLENGADLAILTAAEIEARTATPPSDEAAG